MTLFFLTDDGMNVCPKCEHYANPDVTFVAGYEGHHHAIEAFFIAPVPEHMVVSCQRCGYSVKRPPADAMTL